MRTEWIVTSEGREVGRVATIAELKDVLAAHPGATYKSHAVIEQPCAKHPAFEASNCPGCGTSAQVGR